MSHTVREKKKLISRVRRIRGQAEAIEKALEDEQDASSILQMIASCRGAMNGLIAEVIEGHIRLHIIDPTKKPTAQQVTAAEDLIDVVRSYLK